MTIEDFNKTGFGAGMKIKYKNAEECLIMGIDLEEALIGVEGDNRELRWLRCENCELVQTELEIVEKK